MIGNHASVSGDDIAGGMTPITVTGWQQIHRAAEHVGIALKHPLPEAIAHDDELRAAHAVFLLRKGPAVLGAGR